MGGPELITLGCRLNAAESEAMRRLAPDADDLVIVNSCAVTNEAVRQTRQAIRKAKRARPEARVVVTGCAAQVEPETFAAMPEVARVVGNAEKLYPSSFRRRPESQGEQGAAASLAGIPSTGHATPPAWLRSAGHCEPANSAGMTGRGASVPRAGVRREIFVELARLALVLVGVGGRILLARDVGPLG